MYKNVRNSFIHSCPHLDTTQTSIKRTDKLWNTTQHKNKCTTNIHNDMANFIDKSMNRLDLNSIEILLAKFISKIRQA